MNTFMDTGDTKICCPQMKVSTIHTSLPVHAEPSSAFPKQYKNVDVTETQLQFAGSLMPRTHT